MDIDETKIMLTLFPTNDGAGWDQLAHNSEWAQYRVEQMHALGYRFAPHAAPEGMVDVLASYATVEVEKEMDDLNKGYVTGWNRAIRTAREEASRKGLAE